MRIIKRFSKTSLGQKFTGFMFYSLTSFIYHSIRWTYIIESKKSDIFNNHKGMIFCCWHNRLFLGPHILPRNKIINALQSSHSDGMVTSTAFKFLGINVILGSSNKGGMQAFRKMVKCIQSGESIAITPDGPKGPKEKVKDGIIKLAQITNSPIIPLVWSTRRFKIINSWDNFIIPIPFTKGVYSFGKPIYVEKSINNNEFEICRQKLELEIKRLTKLVTEKVS
ncbi:lysophospholipid acyltransferase family protein [Alphaproteobacteria bacterium]|nr:lysophospholipid acyltransferase family protein [Alphaproteobacteria bacterium]